MTAIGSLSVQGFLEAAMEEGLIADGTVAQDTSQAQGIWGLREGISVALRHAGPLPCANAPAGA